MAQYENEESYACCYSLCLHPGEALTSRVEVKSYIPHMKTKLLINWNDDAEASFHMDCWQQIVTESKKSKTETLFSLEEQEMVGEAKKTAEFFHSDEVIKQEAKRVAEMILSAKHGTVFTGAGISTSAGIGDFRGKGGKWTEQARTQKYGSTATSSKKPAAKRGFTYAGLRPTYTHEALVKLVEMGLIKYVISQNCDGLHRLSGLPRDKISELHGNTFHEKCEDCGARYERPYAVGSSTTTNQSRWLCFRSAKVPAKFCGGCRINHRTGRTCEKKGCDGYLMNTIINFGDNLESSVLDLAVEHSQKKDLMLCLGSSLTVTPACDLVLYGAKPTRLVICNRQPTQYDNLCTKTDEKGTMIGSRVYGNCDHLMREVMACILPDDQLEDWEQNRENRMEQYAKQRSEVVK